MITYFVLGGERIATSRMKYVPRLDEYVRLDCATSNVRNFRVIKVTWLFGTITSTFMVNSGRADDVEDKIEVQIEDPHRGHEWKRDPDDGPIQQWACPKCGMYVLSEVSPEHANFPGSADRRTTVEECPTVVTRQVMEE